MNKKQGFNGVIICDDPLTVTDRLTKARKAGISRMFANTVKRRMAADASSTIIVMSSGK